MISISVKNQPGIQEGGNRIIFLWGAANKPVIKQTCNFIANTDTAETAETGMMLLFQKLDLAFSVVIFDKRNDLLTIVVGPKKNYPLFFSAHAVTAAPSSVLLDHI